MFLEQWVCEIKSEIDKHDFERLEMKSWTIWTHFNWRNIWHHGLGSHPSNSFIYENIQSFFAVQGYPCVLGPSVAGICLNFDCFYFLYLLFWCPRTTACRYCVLQEVWGYLIRYSVYEYSVWIHRIVRVVSWFPSLITAVPRIWFLA